MHILLLLGSYRSITSQDSGVELAPKQRSVFD